MSSPIQKTFSAFCRDLRLIIKESRWLPRVFDCNPDDHPMIYPEIVTCPPPSLLHYAGVLVVTDKHFKRLTTMPTIPRNLTSDLMGGHWFFINGMITDGGAGRIHELALTELFNQPINTLFNPTHGLVEDLIEVMIGRTLGVTEEVSTLYATCISCALMSHRRTVVIAHSQGAIMLANVIRQLAADPKIAPLLHYLECYTFAGGFVSWPDVPEIHVEHFANEFDYVARIGVLSCEHPRGPVHVRRGAVGHLFNRNYLSAFRYGVYCHGKSKLFNYLS